MKLLTFKDWFLKLAKIRKLEKKPTQENKPVVFFIIGSLK